MSYSNACNYLVMMSTIYPTIRKCELQYIESFCIAYLCFIMISILIKAPNFINYISHISFHLELKRFFFLVMQYYWNNSTEEFSVSVEYLRNLQKIVLWNIRLHFTSKIFIFLKLNHTGNTLKKAYGAFISRIV